MNFIKILRKLQLNKKKIKKFALLIDVKKKFEINKISEIKKKKKQEKFMTFYLFSTLKKNKIILQVELENWVNSIHSACAAAFARHRGKTGTLHLLQEEIFRLEKAIETVSDIHAYISYT